MDNSAANNKESRVLLVAIYNKHKARINMHSVYNHFIAYGNIEKMMVIKGKNINSIIWKFFVQMQSMEDAISARK